MYIKIQIISILVSFIYGMFIYILMRFNNMFKGIIKDLLFIYDMVILYIIIIYKINQGIFHIYFFISLTLGYLGMSKCVKFIINYVKSIKNYFIKWYTIINNRVGSYMKKKGLKRAKRRLVSLIVVFLVALVVVSFGMFKVWLQIIDNNNTIESLSKEYNDLLVQEEQLKSDVNKLQDPDYVARYAREKYLYTKDGELIIRIPKSE